MRLVDGYKMVADSITDYKRPPVHLCRSVGSTYNGLVRPSDWLSDKITVIDENWFERMSKRKLFYQP